MSRLHIAHLCDPVRSRCQPAAGNQPPNKLRDFRAGRSPVSIPRTVKCYTLNLQTVSLQWQHSRSFALRPFLISKNIASLPKFNVLFVLGVRSFQQQTFVGKGRDQGLSGLRLALLCEFVWSRHKSEQITFESFSTAFYSQKTYTQDRT